MALCAEHHRTLWRYCLGDHLQKRGLSSGVLTKLPDHHAGQLRIAGILRLALDRVRAIEVDSMDFIGSRFG